jgi:hypothetical protein
MVVEARYRDLGLIAAEVDGTPETKMFAYFTGNDLEPCWPRGMEKWAGFASANYYRT